ncbi:hypothetical Protein YC6258_05787 [Gynuella sunshinyii YC6258]|uniref:Uncharacterized protein n=1 Tax=Gynuella sunshinyii YC6258 TaxID=1445510 RepID=A0A0C5VEZ0_9GAMM|nr:hypothetical Protein YC6258_05787 [Gynuella sunshinyii YC6258]
MQSYCQTPHDRQNTSLKYDNYQMQVFFHLQRTFLQQSEAVNP